MHPNHHPKPIDEKGRIESLDIIRGASVLGILLINILAFGLLTEDTSRWDEMYSKASGIDFWTDSIVLILFEGKMRALFCLLFGAGLMLFIQQKKTPEGKSPWSLFYRRMGWLVVFGLINAHILLWKGDILYFYGLFGMIVFLFRNMRPVYKALTVPLVVIIAITASHLFYQDIRSKYLGHLDAKNTLSEGMTLSKEQEEALEVWEEIRKDRIPDPEESREKIEKMRGSYSDVASLVRPDAFEGQTKYLPILLGDNVSLMLLGMALLQWGYFSGNWKRKYYVRTALLGFGIGLPLSIFQHWHFVTHTPTLELNLEYLKNHPVSWDAAVYQLQRIFLSMGHASLLILLVNRKALRWLMNSLGAAGRMAFTNYILQSVLCTLFFFGYGLGYYEKLSLHQLYYVVLAVWVIELLLSRFWLKHFMFGPLEWLWRSLTYWKIMPLKRKSVSSLITQKV